MSTIQDKLRRAFKRRLDEKLNQPKVQTGKLGNAAGYVRVPGKANRVYVTLGGQVEEVLNLRGTPEIYGLDVTCGYPIDDPGQYQVLGTYGSTPAGINTAISSVGPHRQTHTYPNSDWVPIQLEQIMPGRVKAAGGMLIEVYRRILFTGARWRETPTQTVSLASYQPSTAGKCKIVLITIDTDGEVVLTASDEINLSDLATDMLQYVPLPPVGTIEILAAARVYAGQTAIIQGKQGGNDLGDLRMSGYSIGDVKGPASSTDNHLAMFSGASGKALIDGGAYIAGHSVQDNGTTKTQRSAINIIGATISDDADNDRTTVDFSGSGTGDVSGPSSSVAGNVAIFSGTTGKVLADGGPPGWAGLYPITKPVYADFTWSNQGDASADTTTIPGAIILTDPANSSINMHMLEKAKPSAPFKFTAMILCTPSVSYNSFGIHMRDSATDKIIAFHQTFASGLVCLLNGYYVNHTTYTTDYPGAIANGRQCPVFLRIHDDNTYWRFSFSFTGYSFKQVYSMNRNTPFTPDKIGFNILSRNSGSLDHSGILLSWKEE